MKRHEDSGEEVNFTSPTTDTTTSPTFTISEIPGFTYPTTPLAGALALKIPASDFTSFMGNPVTIGTISFTSATDGTYPYKDTDLYFDKRKVKEISETITIMPTDCVKLIADYAYKPNNSGYHHPGDKGTWGYEVLSDNSYKEFVKEGQKVSFIVNNISYSLEAYEKNLPVGTFKELGTICGALEQFFKQPYISLTQAGAFRFYKAFQTSYKDAIEAFTKQNHMDFNEAVVEDYMDSHLLEIFGIARNTNEESDFFNLPSSLVGKVFSFLNADDVNIRNMGEIQAEPEGLEN